MASATSLPQRPRVGIAMTDLWSVDSSATVRLERQALVAQVGLTKARRVNLTHVALAADRSPTGECTALVLAAAPTDVAGALALAIRLGRVAAAPGTGTTRDLWEALATLAATDLGVARVVEPHLDALAILTQAGLGTSAESTATWGVFAAEGGDRPLAATAAGGAWTLTGVKPWCSLAGRIDRALITAHLSGGGRGLFDVDLRQPGISVTAASWHARGLAEIPSGPVTFENVEATAVGGTDWYLSRPGFAWGGMGVAACWFGGLVAVARAVFAGMGDSPAPIPAMLLGQLDGAVQSARRALAEAAFAVDSGTTDAPAVLAKRVRSAVADASERAIIIAGHALGPAPLALDERHAKNVADLQLYVRQHHAEKDDASLGGALVAAGTTPW